jgi:Mn2+/Fe2+ NRAMP family transporter
MRRPLKVGSIGPGAVVTAAFIGPGTVTTATVAGAHFGFALAWTLLFATLAAIILQEMAARLGVAGRKGLGEAVLAVLAARPALRFSAAAFIAVSLLVGNAAYEGGNLVGAALGAEAAFGVTQREAVCVAIALAAGALLLFGGYRLIERALVVIVAIMSCCFLAAALLVKPDLGALLAGLLTPRLPEGSLPVALGLIGTTIVPYNLFLHAAAARARWASAEAIGDARFDTFVAIGGGGVVSILILVTAAATLLGSGAAIADAADMARQLEPAFGTSATFLLGIGLFAAGFTSAMTAPLATAFAASEILRLPGEPKAAGFRVVALAVLFVGTIAAITGRQPVEIILFAQFANGLLLPIIAAFLLYAVNQTSLLGPWTNGAAANFLGVGVILLTLALGIRALAGVI